MKTTYNFFLFLLVLGAVADAQGGRDAAVNRAKAALSRELGVREEVVELADVTETTWRDSSLGCAERGMVYTPMLIAGYSVVLRVGSDRFVVHVSSDRAVICKDAPPSRTDARDAKLPASDPTTGLKLSEQARTDLAAKLRVGRDAVTITRFRQTTWPDASLGCPAKGRVYPPAKTMGFLIELAANGASYEYHSDMNRVVACPEPATAENKKF